MLEKMKKKTKKVSYWSTVSIGILLIFWTVQLTSCTSYTPKPHGYPRIEFPDRSYQTFSDNCPFRFEMPTYSIMERDTHETAEPCWYNMKFPQFDATIYLSYKELSSPSDLHKLSEEAYKLAMKNNIKADVINETEIFDTVSGNFGVLYDLYGETATPFNFYITDRKKHYIRGAFYFDEYTKTDSVSPVFDFLRVDILNVLNTLEWD